MIYFLNNENEWSSTDNSVMIKVEEMLQRMQTWRGEKSFNVNDGVDYLAVLNGQALLKPQLEDIADQYAQYFNSITIEVETGGENIAVKLRIVLKSGQVVARTLYI
jgi:hypothetical protein